MNGPSPPPNRCFPFLLAFWIGAVITAWDPGTSHGQDHSNGPPKTDNPIGPMIPSKADGILRVATYNVSMYRKAEGELAAELIGGESQQAVELSRVIQTVRPDVLLLCEFDYETDAKSLHAFADRYLAVDQLGAGSAINYPHRLSIPTNTGVLADRDLSGDQVRQLPDDAWGFGTYPGQYAMAVLSRFPIDESAMRTFQTYRWSDLPGALQPTDPKTGRGHYSPEVWSVFRLSSKNHADVPIRIPGAAIGQTDRVLHLLASHPTPPVFDGPEDRNGKRNHDEIRFWNDYVSGPAPHLVDDAGGVGGLGENESFVIAGDLNSDPVAGDSLQAAIVQLLAHPRTLDVQPSSPSMGAATADFGRGFARVDYVLPSDDWTVTDSGVFWPASGEPLATDVTATDHRLVWVDLSRADSPPVKSF